MGTTTDLSTSFTDVSSVGPRRKISLIGSSDCVVAFESGRLVGDTVGVRVKSPLPPSTIDSPSSAPNPATDLVLRGTQMTTPSFDDASTFLRYVVLAGTVTHCWVEGSFPGAAQAGAATTGALGTVELTTAPIVASAPTVVSSNDPRVSVIEAIVDLSGTDGSLIEVPLPSPNVACTITAVKLEMPAGTFTKSDTNYITLTLAKRDGAGGGATTIASCTSKVTGGVQLLAFQDVSMGALAGAGAPTLLATDRLTFVSAKTSAGLAVGGQTKVRIEFTPAV